MAKKKVCYKKKEIEKPMVPKNVIMNPHWQEIEKELDSIRKKNLFRECKVTTGIDFCSNDYLGLAKDDRLKQALLKNVEKSTIGSTASRLIKGHRKDTEIWESIFSKFIQTQASLTVANGFIANLGLLDTIADQKSFIFTDRLNHASILDGIRISGAQKK